MRILVTGAAGLIGSSLVERLLEQGHTVYGLDRENRDELPYHQIRHNPRFIPIVQDVRNPLIIAFDQIDQIYHLACTASPIQYQKDPLDTLTTVFNGTLMMLQLASQWKCPILLASTSEIYGDPHEHPQSETYWGNVNPIGVRSCYNEGKRCAETLAMDFYRQHKTQIKIVRIFNTYGPYMKKEDGRVISNFIDKALKNEDLVVYGDGKQTRSFQYVDDLIEGMFAFMKSASIVTGPINLGNPEEITILALAKKVIERTKSNSRIAYQSLPEDDPLQRKPDISLAEKILMWRPTTPFEEGLDRAIQHFKKTNRSLLHSKL